MKPLVAAVAKLLSAAGCESSEFEAPSATRRAPPTRPPAQAPEPPERKRVTVAVTSSGYEPGGRVVAPAVRPLALALSRPSGRGRGRQIVFPDHDVRRDLALGREVAVELTPRENETIASTCGMGMVRGSAVASAASAR